MSAVALATAPTLRPEAPISHPSVVPYASERTWDLRLPLRGSASSTWPPLSISAFKRGLLISGVFALYTYPDSRLRVVPIRGPGSIQPALLFRNIATAPRRARHTLKHLYLVERHVGPRAPAFGGVGQPVDDPHVPWYVQATHELPSERHDMVDAVHLPCLTRKSARFPVQRSYPCPLPWCQPLRRLVPLPRAPPLATQGATVNNRGASLLNNKQRANVISRREGKSKLRCRTRRAREGCRRDCRDSGGYRAGAS